MNLSTLYKVFDTVVSVLDTRKEDGSQPGPPGSSQTPTPGFADQIEARLTNVVVAALKEAFDRDHERLELERAHLDEQRRRAEETLRMELRRQAVDREIGRLRFLAGADLACWLASVVLFLLRAQYTSAFGRGVLIAGSVLLLCSLGLAFSAQGTIGGTDSRDDAHLKTAAGSASLWLLIAGLAVTVMSLLF
jgi:hypothetical protein